MLFHVLDLLFVRYNLSTGNASTKITFHKNAFEIYKFNLNFLFLTLSVKEIVIFNAMLYLSIILFPEIIDTKSWIFEKHVIEMEVSGVFRSAVRGKIEEKIQQKKRGGAASERLLVA